MINLMYKCCMKISFEIGCLCDFFKVRFIFKVNSAQFKNFKTEGHIGKVE